MSNNICADIAELFRFYVDHPHNIVDGDVNWDYVEADIMMELGVDRIIEEMGSLEEFYPYFNDLVDLHLMFAREAA